MDPEVAEEMDPGDTDLDPVLDEKAVIVKDEPESGNEEYSDDNEGFDPLQDLQVELTEGDDQGLENGTDERWVGFEFAAKLCDILSSSHE